jgi:protein PhnA
MCFGSGQSGDQCEKYLLIDGDHDIDCKIDGFGAMKLKPEFMKKA